MAEDKNNEEESDERRNEYFNDDEDFGLPNLEYDELNDFAEDEEEDEESIPLEEEYEEDNPLEEDEESIPLEEEYEEDNPLEEDEESIPLEEEYEEDNPLEEEEISVFEADDEFSEAAAGHDSSEPEREELSGFDEEEEKSGNDDLDLDEYGGDFYEEESFEEFDTEAATAATATTSGDGASHQELAARDNKGAEFKYSESRSRASFTKIVVFGTVIITLLGFVLFYTFSGGEEVAKTEEVKKPAPKPEPKPEPEPDPDPEPEPAPIQTAPGEVTSLTEKTGNSYIIVGSFVDSDLADDFAEELASGGQSPMIIPPFDNHRFYRVAIASFNSYGQAAAALNGFKVDFGEDIWAIRY